MYVVQQCCEYINLRPRFVAMSTVCKTLLTLYLKNTFREATFHSIELSNSHSTGRPSRALLKLKYQIDFFQTFKQEWKKIIPRLG